MKVFFFLMLLSNITFFLWEFNSVNIVVEVANNEAKQILLLTELPEKQQDVDLIITKSIEDLSLDLSKESKTDELIEKGFNTLADKNSDAELIQQSESLKSNLLDGNTESNQQPETNRLCYQIGPFINKKLLNNWVEINKIDKNSFTTINRDRKIETGFLVYYPQAETYEQSKQHVSLLKNKGITDFWLFRKGELKGNISLGLFTKHARALVLKNRFAEDGINVEIMTRYRVESDWYAKIISDKELRPNRVIFTDKLSFVSSCSNI